MAGKPLPKSWQDAVRQAGSESQAAIDYPTLDPRYQADIKKYGKGKGIEQYSHDVIDPATGADSPGLATQITDNLPGSANYAEQIGRMKESSNPFVNNLGYVGSGILGAADTLGKTTMGHGLGPDQGGSATPGGGGVTKPPGGPMARATGPAPPSASEALMNSLVGQYQAGMATVDPYIGGSNEPGFASQAQAVGQGIAGAGVQAQDPANRAALAGDAQAVQKATDAGAQNIQAALKGTGQADQAFLQVSPYLGILNALTSEAQYKTTTGTPPTSITGSKMPAWLSSAYQATIGANSPGATAVGSPLLASPNPNTSSTTPSSSVASSAGGGNG